MVTSLHPLQSVSSALWRGGEVQKTGETFLHRFAGSATTLGDGVGKAIHAAIREALGG